MQEQICTEGIPFIEYFCNAFSGAPKKRTLPVKRSAHIPREAFAPLDNTSNKKKKKKYSLPRHNSISELY